MARCAAFYFGIVRKFLPFLLPITTRLAGLEVKKNFRENVRPVRRRYAWNLQSFGMKVRLFIAVRVCAWLSRGKEGNSLDGSIAYPVLWWYCFLSFLPRCSNPRKYYGKHTARRQSVLYQLRKRRF